MTCQTVFRRYELKYLITKSQKELILSAIEPYMALDKYGQTNIRNIYFDTKNYRLIRQSIEKPTYKEKLRIRSYGKADPQSNVFVELKKKHQSIVYKRRICLSQKQALDWLNCPGNKITSNQIVDEINYFLDFYGPLIPTVFISYRREAYFCKDCSDFRLTFDDDILYRDSELSLEKDTWGDLLLEKDNVLMELKCATSIPLWLSLILTDNHIYKSSFSKCGNIYERMILPKWKELRL